MIKEQQNAGGTWTALEPGYLYQKNSSTSSVTTISNESSNNAVISARLGNTLTTSYPEFTYGPIGQLFFIPSHQMSSTQSALTTTFQVGPQTGLLGGIQLNWSTFGLYAAGGMTYVPYNVQTNDANADSNSWGGTVGAGVSYVYALSHNFGLNLGLEYLYLNNATSVTATTNGTSVTSSLGNSNAVAVTGGVTLRF